NARGAQRPMPEAPKYLSLKRVYEERRHRDSFAWRARNLLEFSVLSLCAITALTLALMYDLERIPVGVEYIGGVVSRIVLQSCAGRNVVSGNSGHGGLVEFIDLPVVFGHKTPVNGCWIRLPLFEPEECLLAVTESPQIGMTVFSLVRHEESDQKRLQGGLIESQRTFDVADCQNHVVEHRSPFRSRVLHASAAIAHVT